VRAVPHAGDDVPRQPGVPQLQVPAPTQPRHAASAAAQARPPAALLQGLETKASQRPMDMAPHMRAPVQRARVSHACARKEATA
jgi:hypothetical protein